MKYFLFTAASLHKVCRMLSQIVMLGTVFQPCAAQKDSVLHTPNYIDSIKTAQQINDLVVQIDSRYKNFKVNEALYFDKVKWGIDCKKIADSLQIKAWQKADFDNNGLSDLLVVGKWSQHHIICILDKGQNKYEIKSITRRSFQECTFPVVSNNAIDYYFETLPEGYLPDMALPRKLDHITLVYKFGDFIEKKQLPANHTITKIEYQTSGCFGSCPIFDMTIEATRHAVWDAKYYNKINNKQVTGKFSTTISEEKLNEIIQLLNYMDFTNAKDEYAVNWTDDQTATLKITYDNGKTKSIRDYGFIGTYGLNRVYHLLSSLRENQQWIQ